MARTFSVTTVEQARADGQFPTSYKLAIHARQSLKRQVKNNKESHEMQTKQLYKRGLALGWTSEDILIFIENRGKNGKWVDASGTKRIDQRPVLQEIIYLIETGAVKAVLTYAVDRLFRDPDMVEPAAFARICRDHHCIVIINDVDVYDFNNPKGDPLKRFLAEAQAAADYITKHVKGRMHPARRLKALHGDYDGRNIAVGYWLDQARERYIPYEPYAHIIKWLFKRYRELSGNFPALYREVAAMPYLFPFNDDGIPLNLLRKEQGYTISDISLKDLLCNPVYIGWWYVTGVEPIKGNHPAIVSEVDFWYAFDRLSKYTITGEKRDMPVSRSHYNKVGTIPCDALLRGVIRSDTLPVYVFQYATQKQGAMYVITDTKDYTSDGKRGSVTVAELDDLYTSHLLAVIEHDNRSAHTTFAEAKRKRGQRVPMGEMMHLLQDVRQDASTKDAKQKMAGVNKQIAEYQEEADSLDRTLHYGAKALEPEDIERYSTRLAHLRTTLAQLKAKKDRATLIQSQVAAFKQEIHTIPAIWNSMDIESKRRFVHLVTDTVTITKPSPRWLRVHIKWGWLERPDSVCYIWQRQGICIPYTDEENDLIAGMYPSTDRASILEALPRRSWTAIGLQAMRLGVRRSQQNSNTTLPPTMSLEDKAFMQEAGIAFNPEDPLKRVWWFTADEMGQGGYLTTNLHLYSSYTHFTPLDELRAIIASVTNKHTA